MLSLLLPGISSCYRFFALCFHYVIVFVLESLRWFIIVVCCNIRGQNGWSKQTKQDKKKTTNKTYRNINRIKTNIWFCHFNEKYDYFPSDFRNVWFINSGENRFVAYSFCHLFLNRQLYYFTIKTNLLCFLFVKWELQLKRPKKD